MKTIEKRSARRQLKFLICETASAIAFASLFATGIANADAAAQKVFNTPEAAAAALADAAKTQDVAAAVPLLGPGAKEVISSGDPVADKNAALNFANDYSQMHRLAYDSKGNVILYIGAENWPFPIPIVKHAGGWAFDTAAGEKEILYRRIGTNELLTIATLRQVVAAENEYKSGNGSYASKLMSDSGTHDGLYWPVSGSETPSPIGPLIASATAEGYQPSAAGKAYHGYVYKILTGQGANVPGGAKSYISGDKLTGGFAILAFPVEYRSSGIMTFVVNQDGTIFQKDLGPDTAKVAAAVTDYNPDKSWEEVKEYSTR